MFNDSLTSTRHVFFHYATSAHGKFWSSLNLYESSNNIQRTAKLINRFGELEYLKGLASPAKVNERKENESKATRYSNFSDSLLLFISHRSLTHQNGHATFEAFYEAFLRTLMTLLIKENIFHLAIA